MNNGFPQHPQQQPPTNYSNHHTSMASPVPNHSSNMTIPSHSHHVPGISTNPYPSALSHGASAPQMGGGAGGAGGIGVGGCAYPNNTLMSMNGAVAPHAPPQMMGSNACTPDSTLMIGESDPLDPAGGGGSHHPMGHVPFRPTMSPLLSSGRIEQTQAFTWIRRHLIPCEDASVPKQEVYDAYKYV